MTGILIALSFPLGIYTVFFTHLSNSTASTQGYPFLWIGPVSVVIPLPVTYGAAFLVTSAVYAAMFVLAAKQGKGLVTAVSSGLKYGYQDLMSNRAVLTIVSIGFLVFTAAIIDLLVSSANVPVGNPFTGVDDLYYFLELTLAPLREEFGFRVLIIGVAALAVTLPRPGVPTRQAVRGALRTLWRPSTAYEGVSDNTLVIVVLWAAGALSAGTFGACHVACGGGGWDIGKLPEAVYGGVVLAYLYIRYGFHVAVLAHWGIDYLPSVFAFFGQGVYGIPWTSSPGYILQQVISNDLFGIFGIVCLFIVAHMGLTRLLRAPGDPPPGAS